MTKCPQCRGSKIEKSLSSAIRFLLRATYLKAVKSMKSFSEFTSGETDTLTITQIMRWSGRYLWQGKCVAKKLRRLHKRKARGLWIPSTLRDPDIRSLYLASPFVMRTGTFSERVDGTHV